MARATDKQISYLRRLGEDLELHKTDAWKAHVRAVTTGSASSLPSYVGWPKFIARKAGILSTSEASKLIDRLKGWADHLYVSLNEAGEQQDG